MNESIIIFVVVGFFAQMIDGALGMAYGVSSTTFLLTIGVPPVAASASVHTAEIFISGVSGLSHLRFGNVNKKLFKKLMIPGVIGGILGAHILTVIPGKIVKPFIAVYLLIMGLMILRKALNKIQEKKVKTKLFPLGVAGGFFDAIGGGGWGPIMTSTLLVRGNNPRFSVGTVNIAEFFVTIAEVAAFLTMIELFQYRQIIIGLILGGVIAAPLAAFICKKLSSRVLMITIGMIIVSLSLRTIYLAL